MNMIEVEDFSFSYPNMQKPVISHFDMKIKEGSFVLLCGKSGCGKSTLLSHMKKSYVPNGSSDGNIYYQSKRISQMPDNEAASEIGFVKQDVEASIVTDKVWHELSFGLENMGLSREQMQHRIGEMSNFLGISSWLNRDTASLSGGEKQLLELAGVMVMHPKLLLLDEPLAQLDPLAATRFMDILIRLNREMYTTIIMAEHALELPFDKVDRIFVMHDGMKIYEGTNQEVAKELIHHQTEAFHILDQAMPSAYKIAKMLPQDSIPEKIPLSVKEGRDYLHFLWEKKKKEIPQCEDEAQGMMTCDKPSGEILLEMKEVSFRYERSQRDILQQASLKLYEGECLAVVGENGCGKSTLLRVLAGLLLPYEGKIWQEKKRVKKSMDYTYGEDGLVFLPQDPRTLFEGITVLEELEQIDSKNAQTMLEEMQLLSLKDHHPYDLSGGEMQRLALAKLLLTNPKLLLLDEPTKGLDAWHKQQLSERLKLLQKSGKTILFVSHDLDFTAHTASRVGMFFDGAVLSTDLPEIFFGKNYFYTTSASRISRDIFSYAVTEEEVASQWNA